MEIEVEFDNVTSEVIFYRKSVSYLSCVLRLFYGWF